MSQSPAPKLFPISIRGDRPAASRRPAQIPLCRQQLPPSDLRAARSSVTDTQAISIFDNLVAKDALAKRLSVSVSFINKMMGNGLPYYRLGRAVRFSEGEVAAWLQKRRMP